VTASIHPTSAQAATPAATHPPGLGRSAALWGLAWCAGVWLQLQQTRLWTDAAYGAVAVVGLVVLGALVVATVAWRSGRCRPVVHRWPARASRWCITLALLALAFASTGWRAGQRLADRLNPTLEGLDLVVQGVVADLPRDGLHGTRFEFHTQHALLNGQVVAVPQRLSLAWFRGFDGDALLRGPAVPLRAGETWRLTVRLRQPHGLANPGGFDLERWLFERGLGATGSVRAVPGAVLQRLPPQAGAPLWPPELAVARARQALRDRLLAQVSNPTAAGVLAALALGDQAAIERADWDTFRLTGVAHLMSISGLHVTMFAWLAAALVRRLWCCSTVALHRCPAPVAGRWGGVMLAAAYALLAGWGVPAQRTVWMLVTVAWLHGRGLRWPALAVLLAAAVVVSVADPWAFLQAGFWLSFGAVGLLVWSEPARAARAWAQSEVVANAVGPSAPATGVWARLAARWPAGARRGQAVAGQLGSAASAAWRSQLIATVGLAPLSLLFFQQVSVVGLVANLVAIPLVTLFITPLALLGLLWPLLWLPAAAAVQALVAALQWAAAWPWAVWNTPAAPAWAAVAGLLGATVLLAPLPWRSRLWGLPLMLPLLWPAVARPPQGSFELVAADVGQGTAVLVRTARHLLVFDTGPAVSPDNDAGQRVLLPLLRHRGEGAIHRLVLSHRDTDHVGGAASLLQAWPVLALHTALEPGHPLLQRGVPHHTCVAGQHWTWDGVHFEVLHPAPGVALQGVKPNTVSCVLKVSAAQGSALLTGDIEAAQETALVLQAAERPAALASTLLLVPHHGSRTSSTAAFLDAVAPQAAVVQAGYRSRFGHPAPAVLARYAERGIPVWRSDRCGAFTWPAGQSLSAAVCHRQQARRYWHHVTAADPPDRP
jgi:competence protein ComEC